MERERAFCENRAKALGTGANYSYVNKTYSHMNKLKPEPAGPPAGAKNFSSVLKNPEAENRMIRVGRQGAAGEALRRARGGGGERAWL